MLTNGSERDEAVVHCVEVAPLLVGHEDVGGDDGDGHGEGELDGDELEEAHLLVLELEAALEAREQEDDERVEALADRLEHDEEDRYADERVEDAEALAGDRARRRVAVADERDDHGAEVERADELPLVARLVRLLLEHLVPQPVELDVAHVVLALEGRDVRVEARLLLHFSAVCIQH